MIATIFMEAVPGPTHDGGLKTTATRWKPSMAGDDVIRSKGLQALPGFV
jgi:hypothetical protein